MRKKHRFEHITTILPDGSELRVTRELKLPSARCCICGVKLILNEVDRMMCIKCSKAQERLESNQPDKMNTTEEKLSNILPETSSFPSEASNRSEVWSRLDY
jgi:hypothetical protein